MGNTQPTVNDRMSNAARKIEVPTYDAKQEILKKLDDVAGFKIAKNELLLAIYQRPEFTPGGIIQVPQTLKEDIYQGKVGLVVKIGEHCRFDRVDPYTGIPCGIPVSLHDWVVVRPSDTWPLDINVRPDILDRRDFVACRLVKDDQIRAVIANPAMIW
jgi:hypothetical protein